VTTPEPAVVTGTRSHARQRPDGSWDVFDVPIVHEGGIPRFNAKGERVDDFEITPEWMRKAIEVHALRESEGYMGRAFIDHHTDDGLSQDDAGWIRPRRLAELQIEGSPVLALYADIVGIPDWTYRDRVRSGRVPYRSIESLNVASAFIDGLALMPTAAPHFKLPMLTIASETERGASETEHGWPTSGALVACGLADQAVRAHSRRHAMSETTKGAGENTTGGEDKPKSWKDAFEALRSIEVPAEDIPEFVALLTEFAGSLSAASEKKDGEDGSRNGDEVIADQKNPTKAAEPTEAVVKAQAKADAAEAKAAAVEQEMQLRDAVDEAARELEGYNLGSEPRKTIMARAREHGVKGLKLYVETVKAYGQKSPGPAGGQDLPAASGSDGELPAEVLAVTDPDDRAIAIKTHRRIAGLAKAGYPTDNLSLAGAIKRDIARARAKAAV